MGISNRLNNWELYHHSYFSIGLFFSFIGARIMHLNYKVRRRSEEPRQYQLMLNNRIYLFRDRYSGFLHEAISYQILLIHIPLEVQYLQLLSISKIQNLLLAPRNLWLHHHLLRNILVLLIIQVANT